MHSYVVDSPLWAVIAEDSFLLRILSAVIVDGEMIAVITDESR